MVKGGKAPGPPKTPKDTGTQLGNNFPEIFRTQRTSESRGTQANMASSSATDDESQRSQSRDTFTGAGSPQHSCLTKADLSRMTEDIKASIAAAVDDIREDLRTLTGKVTELKEKEVKTTGAIRQLDKVAWAHNRHLLEMSRHMEDLDNRGRRQNIRVRGVPESIEPIQIDAALTAIFNALLERDKETPIDLVRAHRALRTRATADTNPRDIICCLASFKLKEEILSRARTQDEIVFQGNQISLYQDLAPQTLQQRRALKPLLSVLKDQNIPYRWRFPFGLSASRNGRTYLLKNPDELEEFCHDLHIPPVSVPEWLVEFWIPDVSATLTEDRRDATPTRQAHSRSPRQRSPASRSPPPTRHPRGSAAQSLQRFRR